ncbi:MULTISPECIES: hypothetical protein [Streptomyces]|uniref:hypothetical protein n=1 Tax=Streptomyces TaxID=1883 RepID=UPI0019298924|nr:MULTISPECIES: hypothetical protein [unclassified Streptomyces]CAD5923521.1 Flagellar hook-length control protein fliK [Streptomyces sp. KY70]CAD5990764.1 Flagellar hook-length control protein fliK [Streptomyces sp. KY75]
MTRVSARTDRQQCCAGLPASLGWALALLSLLFCCSVTTPAAAAVPVAMEAPGPAPVRTLTPVPDLAVEPVVLAAPADRGLGTSCHGSSTHSAAIVLPVSTAPVALPSPVAFVPVAPLCGAAAIRGPSHDGAHSVDQLRLQVQRI